MTKTKHEHENKKITFQFPGGWEGVGATKKHNSTQTPWNKKKVNPPTHKERYTLLRKERYTLPQKERYTPQHKERYTLQHKERCTLQHKERYTLQRKGRYTLEHKKGTPSSTKKVHPPTHKEKVTSSSHPLMCPSEQLNPLSQGGRVFLGEGLQQPPPVLPRDGHRFVVPSCSIIGTRFVRVRSLTYRQDANHRTGVAK